MSGGGGWNSSAAAEKLEMSRGALLRLMENVGMGAVVGRSAPSSMGPPFITAENAVLVERATERERASMGPPFITAENPVA